MKQHLGVANLGALLSMTSQYCWWHYYVQNSLQTCLFCFCWVTHVTLHFTLVTL